MKLKTANKLDIRNEQDKYIGCFWRPCDDDPYIFVGNNARMDAKTLRELADKLDELNSAD